MATAPEDIHVIEPPRDTHLQLEQIVTLDNVAEHLDESLVTRIGNEVIRDFKLDDTSRKEWLDDYEKWLKTAMQRPRSRRKTFPWPGASNIVYPLLTTACVQFQARAYPAIVDGSNLVKGRVLGRDPDGEKRKRADRIAMHMTWQLLYRMPDWEEDTDKLLLMLPIVGCVFRKTYYDPVAAVNCSDMVPAEDFVIDYWAKSLESAPRYTHIIRLYPHEVEERIRSGLWMKVRISSEDQSDDTAAEVEFYEQHRLIDLDGDGYPEPYAVVTNKDGQVARIAPCFGEEDIITDSQTGQIVRIERRQYFVKYGFLPAPDGSFYDVGFGKLLQGLGEGVNAILNQMIDAGTLANAGGGWLGSGINIRGGVVRITPGEWKRIDSPGGSLKDNIVPNVFSGPAPVMFNLLEFLINAGKEITSVQDILTGATPNANTPATTTLAQIQQATKVMTGIIKRILRAFGKEVRILRRLNGENINQTEYFMLNDDQQAVEAQDYQDKDLDVVPVADPSEVNDMQKLQQSEVEWQSFNMDPLVNQVELRRRRMEALGITDIQTMLKVPQPPPDPKVLIEGAKLALEKMKIDAAYDQQKGAAASSMMTAAIDAAQLGLLNDAAIFAGAAIKLAQESSQYTLENEGGQQPAGGPGAVQGMEGPAPDQGVPGLPGPPAGQPDEAMGGGDVLPSDAGGAGTIPGEGVPAGPVAGPVS